MFVAASLDRGDIGRLAIQMDEHERLGRLTGLGLLLDGRAGERRIHVPAAFFGINEDGLGPEIGDGRGRSDKGERGAEDFIARADTGKS